MAAAAAASSISLSSLTLTHHVESSARARVRFDFRVRCSVPPKTVAKSLPLSRPTSEIESVVKKEGADRASERKLSDGFFGLASLRDGVRLSELGAEILSIALPAALALAADPITSLVDTAYVGHIGSSELAAVGVSASIFNLVSKLFNVPLLNITTSFVAEEQALKNKDSLTYPEPGFGKKLKVKKPLPSVSTSLALATGIGIAETLVLSSGLNFWMNLMGITFDSPIRVPAEGFLLFRAFGAPAIVVALAAQGAFRGFKDTKTPLYAIGAGNLLNAILGPILIFLYGFGVGGAAISTVISEYLIAFILLWKLNDEVLLISPDFNGRKAIRYLKSGGLLIGRTIAVLTTMTLATSMAARSGPIPLAGYQICTQVWLTVSLLTDALAIAGQALLARGFSQKKYKEAREVVLNVLQIGIGTGVALAVFLFLGFGTFARLFTTDSEVLQIVFSGILFVAGTQPINAIAFVIDGLYYGVSDFGYASYSMICIGVVSSGFLLAAGPTFGLTGVWLGLSLFMMLRVVAGVWRLGTKSGPWELVYPDKDEETEWSRD